MNGSNTRSKSPAAMPIPVSATLQQQISVLVQPRADGHRSAGLGELHGVREQMVQHLLKPALIRLQHGKLVWHSIASVISRGPSRRIGPDARRSAAGEARSIRSAARSKRPASIRATSRMLLISASRLPAGPVDLVRELLDAVRVGLAAFAQQGVGEPDHRVERRPQLVAHRREEAGFRLIGRFSRLLGAAQLDLSAPALRLRP